METIQFYGADLCADCTCPKTFVHSHNIPFAYIDINLVEGAVDKAAELNHGMRRIPTIV